jgi:hypothetical protein
MRSLTCLALLTFVLIAVSPAQQASTTAVPNLINYSGTLLLPSGVGVPAKTVGVTFAIYRQQDGGAPIWLETQNVTPDAAGHYSILLGSTRVEGIPAEIFSTQEQRWLGVQVQGEAEQPRVMLVSVPYALKSRDAETVGGLPPSAFVLAAPPNSTRTSAASAMAAAYPLVPGTTPVTTAGGTVNHLAKFDAKADIKNSIIFDNGTNVGIGTTSPAAKLGVNGNVSAAGFNIGSNPFAFGSNISGNAFLGFAGNNTTTGGENTASGYQALPSNTTGCCNTATGVDALLSNTTGSDNTATGGGALEFNTTGNQNTAAGTIAGITVDASDMTGSDNTAIGTGTAFGTGSLTNATAIGANAEVDTSNSLVLGSINGVNGATADTLVGVGITNPRYKLHVGFSNGYNTFRVEGPSQGGIGAVAASFGGFGDFNIDADRIVAGRFSVKESGGVTIGPTPPLRILTVAAGFGHPIADGWDSYSSRRWKTNIQTLHGALGKVEQLRGVSYDLKDSGKHRIGVIAEEVGAVVPEVVTWEKNGKDAQGVDYGRLTALLIEATKEQQKLIHKQQEQIRAQQAQITRLSSQIKVIQASLSTNGGNGSEVRTVKAKMSVAQQ